MSRKNGAPELFQGVDEEGCEFSSSRRDKVLFLSVKETAVRLSYFGVSGIGVEEGMAEFSVE